MCTPEEMAKAALHWMANNSGYLEAAFEDLEDGEIDTVTAELVTISERSDIIEAIARERENAEEPDETDLSEILKYRKALLKELAWVDRRKKELLTELGNNYPEEKVTRKKPRPKK